MLKILLICSFLVLCMSSNSGAYMAGMSHYLMHPEMYLLGIGITGLFGINTKK